MVSGRPDEPRAMDVATFVIAAYLLAAGTREPQCYPDGVLAGLVATGISHLR